MLQLGFYEKENIYKVAECVQWFALLAFLKGTLSARNRRPDASPDSFSSPLIRNSINSLFSLSKFRELEILALCLQLPRHSAANALYDLPSNKFIQPAETWHLAAR